MRNRGPKRTKEILTFRETGAAPPEWRAASGSGVASGEWRVADVDQQWSPIRNGALEDERQTPRPPVFSHYSPLATPEPLQNHSRAPHHFSAQSSCPHLSPRSCAECTVCRTPRLRIFPIHPRFPSPP